jgi:hypothetical protein
MGPMFTGLPGLQSGIPGDTPILARKDRATPGSVTLSEVACGHVVSLSVGKSYEVVTKPAEIAPPEPSATAEEVRKAGPGPE